MDAHLLKELQHISYTMPPYATAYSFDHSLVIPKDYYGYTILKKVAILENSCRLLTINKMNY